MLKVENIPVCRKRLLILSLCQLTSFIEKRAKRLFRIWAGIIKRFGKTPRSRRLWVSIYKYYLIIALFIVAPIVLLVYYILVLPFVYKRVAAEKKRVRLNLI